MYPQTPRKLSPIDQNHSKHPGGQVCTLRATFSTRSAGVTQRSTLANNKMLRDIMRKADHRWTMKNNEIDYKKVQSPLG
ncbi:hypothetical protein KIN20_005765 [Parelaphostrongylus tenuis]|uniref:Uncharacterized protein n=1 Tax=Parelaphostrongylus tenuis TaxID=148309 RepID=A0AAD5M510_PARTN|nr:hypothetical protein KIN20_005765 [Parelaphostrongylus tenuis]